MNISGLRRIFFGGFGVFEQIYVCLVGGVSDCACVVKGCCCVEFGVLFIIKVFFAPN